MALRPPSGGQQNRGRVSVPTAALSGPIPKAPGFAGGYLLAHLRKWRKSVEQALGLTLKVVLTMIVTGLCGAVWLGLKTVLGK